MTENVVGGR